MLKIIKRGGFREQSARQLTYQQSVNQRADIASKVGEDVAQPTTRVEHEGNTAPDSELPSSEPPFPESAQYPDGIKP